MACARCDFCTPKESTKAQLVEAKADSQRMLVSIPLTEEERAAVEDGQSALDRLPGRLAEAVTQPAGPRASSAPDPVAPAPDRPVTT
ncbi:hypothetical protein ACFU7Y_41005 [Kitasatospora sp. NPDC057542]|uniref:hypothetical protein n=1 Tax=Streptomycetaceae TaxID=2062 RepID=UPI001CCAA275|nr:hypothetical protein [Streptomyces sp. LS1784]